MKKSTLQEQISSLISMDQKFPLTIKNPTAIIVFALDEFYCCVKKSDDRTTATFYCDSIQDHKGLQMLLDLMEIKYSMDSHD